MGPCAGGAVYSPAMTDFIFMVKDSSYMFVTGPDVVKTVTHEEVTAGGAGRRAHPHARSRASPTSRSRTTSRRCCMLRRFFDFLPLEQPREGAGARRRDDPADRDGPLARHAGAGQPEQALRHQGADPQGRRRRRLLRAAARLRRRTSSIGFGRMDGQTVGIVANQPLVLAGCLDIKSSHQGARASCASATPSTSRSSPSSTCRASCRAPRRSTAASSSTAPSCSTPTPSARCRRSP